MLGYEDDELDNHISTWKILVHPDDKARVLQAVNDYIDGRKHCFEVEMRMLHREGHTIVVLSRAFLTADNSSNKPLRLVGTHVDITVRKHAENYSKDTAKILEMIAIGRPADSIYDAIAQMYEVRHPDMRCSMLELEGDHLLHGGVPSMPEEYCKAINGLKIGPGVGSCGTSTYTGERCLDLLAQPIEMGKNCYAVCTPELNQRVEYSFQFEH